MTSFINKAKKPKFEVHLRIYDLNNVPLVNGVSQVKWHLPHSIHGEHRGRTAKCPIANHKVEYNYGKIVPVRIHIDRDSNLEECPIEFEVLQEFNESDERIVLGKVTLNLSEYVEESEAFLRERPGTSSGTVGTGISGLPTSVAGTASAASAAMADQLHHQVGKLGLGHSRHRSSMSNDRPPPSPGSKTSSPGNSTHREVDDSASQVREGIVRRHLMQESKINSTLKVGILMIQVDGDRNYVAPPLKTAPVFGGIAGIGLTGEQIEQDETVGHVPVTSKSRDATEIHDMYRTSLAATIIAPPTEGELPADACIEDIFGGGSGFTDLDGEGGGNYKDNSSIGGSGIGRSNSSVSANSVPRRQRSRRSAHFSAASSLAPPSALGREDSGGGSPSSENDGVVSSAGGGGTLRPRDAKAFFSTGGGHRRQRSGASERSARSMMMMTSTTAATGGRSRSRVGGGGRDGGDMEFYGEGEQRGDRATPRHHGRGSESRSRADSLASFATTAASSSDSDGFRRTREVDEFEVRDDLISWRLPGKVA